MVAVALELEHAVDEMLEHPRAGDGTVLRHVPDEDRRDACLLRDAQQPPGRLAHLRDRARGRAELGRVQRLHGVDDAHVGPLLLEGRADRRELGLGEDPHAVRAPQPGGAQRDLRRGLLARDEQRSAPAARDRAESAEQERRLAHAGLPAHEHERGRHEPAAEDPVELGDPRRDPLRLARRDLAERNGGARRAGRSGPAGSRSSSTSVPNASQPGHFPSQRGLAVPHSEQTYLTTTFATECQSRSGGPTPPSPNVRRLRLQVERRSIRVPGTREQATTERTGRMERFNALGRGMQMMLVGAVLLLISMFFPWQDVDVDLADALGETSVGQNGMARLRRRRDRAC